MATQGTDNLVIVDNMPAVEKLWNGRYRLEFFCKIQNPNEGWYSDSIDNWLPEFGALQDADFAGEGWSARDGEAYPDMRLVKCEAKYIAPSETHLVTLTYETLTASWVAEKDEDIDYELNGLQRVSRTFVALPETSYAKVVGTDTITVGGDTLTLGAFKIEKTDAMWSLTETWLESGRVSTSTDLVGSQQAQVIESFGEIPVTPSGYSLAKTDVSNFGGIPTNRYTFLKPSILSVSQQFIGGSATVQVQAFNKTSSDVDTALSEVTASHVLISEGESDYEGIKTSTYQYQLDESFTEDYELNGLKRISLIELSSTDFTAQTVGNVSATTPTTGLYLGTQNIDNGGSVKLRESIWLESGVLSVSTTPEATGLSRVSTTYLAVEDAATNPVVSRTTQNVDGLKTITVSTLERTDGSAITDGNPTNTFGTMFNFSYPGVVGASKVTTTALSGDTAINRFFYQSSPVQRPIPATSYVFFQTDALPVAADYVYDGASGLWSPSEWAGGTYYGWRYQRDNFGTPIGERPSFRGFRSVEDDDGEIAGVYTSLSGTATDDDGLSGTLLLADTTFEISVSGGPEKPDGKKYTLGTIDIEPAFIDVDGVQYYKKVITVATIPAQGGSVIT